MPETFLILLAGGVMLAAAVSDPKQVTLNWLRLAGIIALSVGALAAFFYFQRESGQRDGGTVLAAALVAVLGQLALVQVAWRGTQRALAALAFALAVAAGVVLLGKATASAAVIRIASCAGIAAMTGLALMDMLLGHAYLTASKMTIAPFRRLNLWLAAVIGVRTVTAVAGPLLLNRWRPVEMLWGVYGLYMLTRWAVGLAVPAVFVYMAHDCIRRRSTQSATGILYVTGVLVFIGEIVALYLLRETGLPF
jgi:hypothetical protein